MTFFWLPRTNMTGRSCERKSSQLKYKCGSIVCDGTSMEQKITAALDECSSKISRQRTNFLVYVHMRIMIIVIMAKSTIGWDESKPENCVNSSMLLSSQSFPISFRNTDSTGRRSSRACTLRKHNTQYNNIQGPPAFSGLSRLMAKIQWKIVECDICDSKTADWEYWQVTLSSRHHRQANTHQLWCLAEQQLDVWYENCLIANSPSHARAAQMDPTMSQITHSRGDHLGSNDLV